MKLPYRKAITSLSEEHMMILLSKHFGDRREPDYYFGLGVGPGWNDIVYDLNKKLEAEKPDYQILQIKEKFAGLRFYTDAMPYPAWDAVSEAEKLSLETCEECGRPGKIWSSRGWIRTLCWIDHKVSEINKTLWIFHRGGLKGFFRTYFYYRRLRKSLKQRRSTKK